MAALSLLHLLHIALIAIPIQAILTIVYRIFFHPLAKYPGPLLWRISGWPDYFAAASGTRHLAHYKLHCQYGHVVRIGPNRLSYDTPEAFYDMNNNRNANVVKAGFVGFNRDVADSMHIQQITNKREHAQRRKILAHAFTDNALRSAESFMLEKINRWFTALEKGSEQAVDGWSEKKDLGHWANVLTMDIFGELCFGEDFKATETGDNEMIHFLLNTAQLSHRMTYSPINFLFKPLLRRKELLKWLSPKMYHDRFALRSRMISLVSKRQQAELDAEKFQSEARKDIFHYILQGRDDDGNMLPLQNYVSESVFLIAAGTDTTSTAIAATLFYLLRNPEMLEKLRKEVCDAFDDVEDIVTGHKLSGLTYLRACIDESLRMTPPVPGSLTRQTLVGGAMVQGELIPTSTEMEVPMYALMHNHQTFPDHTQFLPERWIAGSKTPNFEVTDDLLARQKHALVPFSVGPRNCLGMKMAYMEMTIVLARLVFLYDIRFDRLRQPVTNEFDTTDWFISAKEGPYLQFRPRMDEKV